MALRLLEMIVPRGARQATVDLLAEAPVVGTWTAELEGELLLVRVLAEAERLETLINAAEARFGAEERFRLMLLAVEATVPAVEEAEREAAEEASAEGEEAAPEEAPSPRRVACVELVESLDGGTRVTRPFLVTTALSAVVAALGLMRDSPAVVIGAMVIAPLLLPNIALALATTLGDSALARRSLRTAGTGFLVALAVAIGVGLLVPFDPAVREIQSRSAVDYGDIVLALSAGTAGALAFTSGVSAMLVGVMVAVALLPPLVVTALLLATGRWPEAARAALLVMTNVICVNLSGVATFLLQGVRPGHWWEAERAKRMVRMAAVGWIALLVVLAGLIYLSRIA